MTGLDWNTIILAIIALIGATIGPILGVYMAKIQLAAKRTLEFAEQTQTEIAKVHTAVNSERTAMIDEVRKLRDEVLRLSTLNATKTEMIRAAGEAEEKRNDD